MPDLLNRIGRAAVHAPRRFLYAFLWSTRPPEDAPDGGPILPETNVMPAPAKPTVPRAF